MQSNKDKNWKLSFRFMYEHIYDIVKRLSSVLCIFIKGGTEAFTTEAKSMLHGRQALRLFIKIAISKKLFYSLNLNSSFTFHMFHNKK